MNYKKTRRQLSISIVTVAALLVGGMGLYSESAKADPNKWENTVDEWTFSGPKPPKDSSEVKPDSTPELNLADPKNPDHDKRSKISRGTPLGLYTSQQGASTESSTENYYATLIDENSDITAVYAGLEPHTSISFSTNGQVLYGGTVLSPNYSVLEAVLVYAKESGVMKRFFGVYDHDAGDWIVEKKS